MARDRYSAKTSLAQIAAVFKPSIGIRWLPGTRNLDVGGGRYDLGTQHLASLGVANLVFDPGNRPESWNDEVVRLVTERPADTATISNVLNVIESPEDRLGVLAFAAGHVRRDGVVYITVYEGDGKGVGKETPKGWQENRTTVSYVPEVAQVFGDVKRKGKLIIAREPLVTRENPVRRLVEVRIGPARRAQGVASLAARGSRR